MSRLRAWLPIIGIAIGLGFPGLTWADEPSAKPRPTLVDDFPPPESQGGWKSMLPESGTPDEATKREIKKLAGVDWDKLEAAWAFNAESDGKTGLLVIRRGRIVGEWYKGADKTTAYNIYSSSKSYTSTAFGLILSDFGNPTPAGGKPLSLDTKVCNADWIAESLPLPDPRKAEITVRHLLNMASGTGEEGVPNKAHYEWALGLADKSPFARLKSDPGKAFHYSNAGVAHLVLLFQKTTGTDLFPFLKERLFDPIGETQIRWQQVGGDGAIGPFSQGFSGIYTTPREHARYCYLALHKGVWAGKRIVPEAYYDFAWASSPANNQYGAQWWVGPHFPGAPADFVATVGKDQNDGFVVPSLDLVVVRLGDGTKFPKDFERGLIQRVLAAVEK